MRADRVHVREQVTRRADAAIGAADARERLQAGDVSLAEIDGRLVRE